MSDPTQWTPQELIDDLARQLHVERESRKLDFDALQQTLFDLGNGTAVNFNPRGRFHGWLFRQHPDGQWVSVKKLEKSGGSENEPRAEQQTIWIRR